MEMGMMPYLVLIFWVFGFIFFWKFHYPKSTRRLDETSSKISIIIPARNEERNLSRLVQSIKDQNLKAHEIIVIDDHSKDLTAEIGRRAGCMVIPTVTVF